MTIEELARQIIARHEDPWENWDAEREWVATQIRRAIDDVTKKAPIVGERLEALLGPPS